MKKNIVILSNDSCYACKVLNSKIKKIEDTLESNNIDIIKILVDDSLPEDIDIKVLPTIYYIETKEDKFDIKNINNDKFENITGETIKESLNNIYKLLD